MDTYILSKFLFYFLLLLSSFVMMTQVYTFFELLSDMVRNKIPMARMLTYLLFLTPKLIYDTLPDQRACRRSGHLWSPHQTERSHGI